MEKIFQYSTFKITTHHRSMIFQRLSLLTTLALKFYLTHMEWKTEEDEVQCASLYKYT